MSENNMNLPSNSDASKQAAESKKDIKPVSNGRVERKHQFFKRTLEVFSGKNLEASADDVIENVIVPALWDLLRESVHALWDRILDKSEDAPRTSYRSQNSHQQTNNGNYVPYGSASASKRSNLGRRGDFIDTVYFSSRQQADDVIKALNDIMDGDKDHWVSVEDFCSIANIKGDTNYMNSNWGWNDLSSVKVRHTLNGEYWLTLPKVIPAKKQND